MYGAVVNQLGVENLLLCSLTAKFVHLVPIAIVLGCPMPMDWIVARHMFETQHEPGKKNSQHQVATTVTVQEDKESCKEDRGGQEGQSTIYRNQSTSPHHESMT